MKIKMSVYYTDGSNNVIEFEKPPGAHPDSIRAIYEGLLMAEGTGKSVVKIGREYVNPFSKPPGKLVVNDELLITRELLMEKVRTGSP